MYKLVRKLEALKREISPSYSSYNLITKSLTENVSLAKNVGVDHFEETSTDYERIYFVLSGQLILEFHDKREELFPGDACWISESTKYRLMGTFETIVVNQPAFGTRSKG